MPEWSQGPRSRKDVLNNAIVEAFNDANALSEQDDTLDLLMEKYDVPHEAMRELGKAACQAYANVAEEVSSQLGFFPEPKDAYYGVFVLAFMAGVQYQLNNDHQYKEDEAS